RVDDLIEVYGTANTNGAVTIATGNASLLNGEDGTITLGVVAEATGNEFGARAIAVGESALISVYAQSNNGDANASLTNDGVIDVSFAADADAAGPGAEATADAYAFADMGVLAYVQANAQDEG